MRRFALFSILTILVAAALPCPPARAVQIDRGLAALLAEKADSERLPVLMIYDDPGFLDDAIQDLDKLDPDKRRRLILERLKKKALKVQQNAVDLLTGPDLKGQVAGVRQLYLAGALVFEGTPAAISALAELQDAAVLFHDKPYDLTAATRPGADLRLPDKKAAPDTAWGVKAVGAPRVWRDLGFDGTGVVVGLIDTGVSVDHPDLANRLWVNPGEIPGNGLDDDGNGFVDDVHGYDFGVDDGDPDDDSPTGGHGTHTAGTVAGDGTGGVLTGVAPGVRIMALKVWQADGSGGSLGMIWAAEQYAVENGARIISMSLGIERPPLSYMRVERINCDNIRRAGVLLINSAGNNHGLAFIEPPYELNLTARVPPPWSREPVPFSSTGGVLAVGALGYKQDITWEFSSEGPVDWGDIDPWRDWDYDPGPGLIRPEVVAPGENINSTLPGGGYSGDTWSGTSMACPHVAGVAAMMLQKNPSLSPAGLDSLLELSARDLGAPGKDNVFGSGALDAFAAVSAVPGTQAPLLSLTGFLPDPDGDAVLDAGQVSEVAFQLANVSPVVDSGPITAELALAPDPISPVPLVSVVDGTATFPPLAAGGAKGDNLDDPFLIRVDAEALQGHPIRLLLTVRAGAFARTFDLDWYVGLPKHRTHETGAVYLTVTDQGSLGYLDPEGSEGRGMGLVGAPSALYVGSFWAGTGQDYVCNRDFGGNGRETFEWVVSTDKDDNGRVRDLSTTTDRQEYRAIFHDGGHASPMPLYVEQNSLACTTPPDDGYVIVEYTMTNLGGAIVRDVFAGVFCDFDVDPTGKDLGGTDPQRNLVYISGQAGPYFGVALLDSLPAATLTLVDNEEYVYDLFSISDQDKFGLLSGALRQTAAPAGKDWSLLASTRLDLDPDARSSAAFALVTGRTLAELQAAADAAYALYLGGKGDRPPLAIRLDQNVPNPFNPTTRIEYVLDRAGPAGLTVYDLRGVRVRTLLRGDQPEGPGSVDWDGTDDLGRPLPSGTYLYRLEWAGGDVSRKMTLIR